MLPAFQASVPALVRGFDSHACGQCFDCVWRAILPTVQSIAFVKRVWAEAVGIVSAVAVEADGMVAVTAATFYELR